MAESMSTLERTVRMLYGSGASVYFCLPDVTMAGALSFGTTAVLMLATAVTGLPGTRQAVLPDASQVVEEFTA